MRHSRCASQFCCCICNPNFSFHSILYFRWLDTLQREINSASHGHSAAVSVAWKENAGPKRGSGGKLLEDLAKPAAPVVVDYALGYEAKARYSNSKRAFGEALSTIDVNRRTDEQKENAQFLAV